MAMMTNASVSNYHDDVCVLILTLNEAAIIGDIVAGFRDEGFSNILVLDGGSTDATRDIAKEQGARVVLQQGDGGKGQGVREAIQHIDAPYILMADGDGTYRPEDAETMLAPLLVGNAEHVIGNRFANMESGAMTRINQFGNRLIQRAFRLIHRESPGDILSGYRAFTLRSIERMNLSASGFGIETEMAVECARLGITTVEVPITYRARPADTETKLNPIRDGATIWLTLYSLAKTNNPLFYFGSLGAVSLLSGIGVALFVAYRWFVFGTSHDVLALVSASGVLVGLLLLMFAVLSDMIHSLHEEQQRRLDRLAAQLEEEKPRRTDEGLPERPSE